jgi:hypothetical protein
MNVQMIVEEQNDAILTQDKKAFVDGIPVASVSPLQQGQGRG